MLHSSNRGTGAEVNIVARAPQKQTSTSVIEEGGAARGTGGSAYARRVYRHSMTEVEVCVWGGRAATMFTSAPVLGLAL
ncbi:hypothetical protein NDU88_002267 [Pleurodeles waltl]|uniref:Uncharacterized protein n=1 Tax=Pleurodeles waltl TaxID=8319 RepID=A0AAV7VC14_PLEWA|nr:hypothetical protein NDU88_002267 [Pleurodeles waltl]